MDANVSNFKNGVSLKNFALFVLCFYAAVYPLFAYMFMIEKEEGAGTIAVQLFQATPILALAYLWRFRRKARSLKEYVDVWTISFVYFTAASTYFALFYTTENQVSELVYAARFLSWFFLAATLKRLDLEPKFWERLAKSFWTGAIIQCGIAIYGFAVGSRAGGSSIYTNVYATTGSTDVSGKTVVAFVVLAIALSVYWSFVKRSSRLIYASAVVMGLAVVLCSYNRAAQLGLAVAYVFAFQWCVRKKRLGAAAAMLVLLAPMALFLFSNYGQQFTARWALVRDDRGSGRAEMLEIALRSVSSPPSTGVLWFGRGSFQTREMMYEEIGSRIGLHNDLCDFVIMYGLVGGALYLWSACSLLSFQRRTPPASIENSFTRSATIFVLLTGLVTGMYQATYVFFMLVSTQYYFLSQARAKALAWDEYCFARAVEAEEAFYDEEEEYDEDDEYDERGECDDYNDYNDYNDEIDGGCDDVRALDVSRARFRGAEI